MHRQLVALIMAAFFAAPAAALAQSDDSGSSYSTETTPVYTHETTALKHRQHRDSSSLHLYSTEEAASGHCPNDAVVWLNTNTGIYHERGMRWYGHTRIGAYVCVHEANAVGDRDTRNGQ